MLSEGSAKLDISMFSEMSIIKDTSDKIYLDNCILARSDTTTAYMMLMSYLESSYLHLDFQVTPKSLL